MRPWPALLAALLACQRSPAPPADAYVKSIDDWHTGRVQRLTAPTGWLAVAGLYWLKEGPNTAGSAGENALRFPASAPAKLGTFERHGSKVTFAAAPGATVTHEGRAVQQVELATDKSGKPTMLQSGTLTFFVIERGARVGVRLRDTEAKARKSFTRINRFPVDPRYRIEARWEPSDKPRKIAVPNILGSIDEENSPGTAVFEIDGKAVRLSPIVEGDSPQYFFIFGDATTGKETYGAGRFLYSEPAKDGKVVLDFNKAYNPPCAFTPFATCPLPPDENKLHVAIRAGEKDYGHH